MSEYIPFSTEQFVLLSRDDIMEAFKFAQVKYELTAPQRRALGDHPNYEEAMFRAYLGSLGSYANWRRFEEICSDVLAMKP